ncbi:MAG: hypothetical protein HKP19_13635, partial [Xanthomonadales bacterium]|nr:hypothetical protein [Xanthomonadales bacterium]
EASGLQAGRGDVFFVHNDEKRDIFVIDPSGRDLGSFKLDGARSRDWEDIARAPGPNGPLLVIGDVGDNRARRKDVELFFFDEPRPDEFNRHHEVIHTVSLRYPDGPRDTESMAYDPSSGMMFLLTKRDRPPRLYGVPLATALAERRVEAEFLAEVPGFRPPTAQDILVQPGRGFYVSQPTGMDISPDGRRAAVITYRSLYLFERCLDETWVEAFQKAPIEIVGPPGTHQEAVAFSADGYSVYVTTERRPAPLHRLDLHPEQTPQRKNHKTFPR